MTASAPTTTDHAPPCGECGAWMRVIESNGRKFYGCPNYPVCRCTHGMHPDGKPMGIPANEPTRKARARAHAAFDKLWEPGGPLEAAAAWHMHTNGDAIKPRHLAYRWMRFVLAMTRDEAHIGKFNEWQCAELIGACLGPTFEIRWVDTWNQKFVKTASAWFYDDALYTAAIAAETGDDFIIWDRIRRKILYDTRARRPLPIEDEHDEAEGDATEPAEDDHEHPERPPGCGGDGAAREAARDDRGYPPEWDDL